MILVEHGKGIVTLEDVYFWKNPRKHEVKWRTVNGQRVKYVDSAKAVDGKQLYKSYVQSETVIMFVLSFARKRKLEKRYWRY